MVLQSESRKEKMMSKAKYRLLFVFPILAFLFNVSCKTSGNLKIREFELGYKVINTNCEFDSVAIQSPSKFRPIILNDSTVITFKSYMNSTFDPRYCLFLDQWSFNECEKKVILKKGLCIINENEKFVFNVTKKQNKFIFTLQYQNSKDRFSIIFGNNTEQFINDFRKEFVALNHSNFEIQCTNCE